MDINIADLKIDTKQCTFEFPGFEGFKIDVNYISREQSKKLYNKATKTEWDKSTRRPVQKFDNDMFLELLIDAAIDGWSGLKAKYLKELILVDLGNLDPETEITYSKENAKLLLTGSEVFDQVINDHIYDLQSFQE